MGRIKPPSGAVFRREAKPGYMVEREVRKGKNWQLQLDDTLNILQGAEKLYTSPLLRDAVGGVGELGSWVAKQFDDDEETLKKGAEARVAAREPAAPEPAVAPVPEPAADILMEEVTVTPPAPPVPLAERSIIDTGRSIIDPTLDSLTEDILKRLPPLPRRFQEIQAQLVERITVDPTHGLEAFKDAINNFDSLSDNDKLAAKAYWEAKKQVHYAQGRSRPTTPAETAAAQKTQAALKSEVDALREQAKAKVAEAKAATEAAKAAGEEVLEIPLLTEEELTDIVPAAPAAVEPTVAPTPAAPAPAAVEPTTGMARPAGYVPPTIEQALDNRALARIGSLLTTQAATDVVNVRKVIGDLYQNPDMSQLIDEAHATAPTPQNFENFLATMVDISNDLGIGVTQPTAAPAPAADVSGIRITEGMNLGQAQAQAAGLALAGGSQADLAAMLEDVGNITGVSSVEGGFGRWVAGGREGGYFMDPGAVGTALKKAYDTALTARRTGRSKALMDAYRQVQTRRGETAIIKQLADIKRQRETAASNIEAKRIQNIQRVTKMAEDVARFNAEFPIDLYIKWLTGSQKAFDLGKDLIKKIRKKGKAGPGTAALRTYQSQLNSSTKSLETFVRSNSNSTNNNIAKLANALASIDRHQGIDTQGLSDDEIVALYGSDMNAYRRDKRGDVALSAEDKKELKTKLNARKKELEKRQKEMTRLNRKISNLSHNIMSILSDPKKRQEKKDELDTMNSLLEDHKDKLTELLGGTN
jgi:hypothetical protein